MRLVTRSDFDGLISGAILNASGVIDSWKFVHPKDVQDGAIAVDSRDILVNVPYAPGCAMWFDHHQDQIERFKDVVVPGERRVGSTSARMLFNYYMCDIRLPHLAPIIDTCDKVFKADLSVDEILNPDDRLFFAFLMDPRTGLGRFRNFRISNLALMDELLAALKEKSFSQIMSLPDVIERRELFFAKKDEFVEFLRQNSRANGKAVLTDLRGRAEIPPGNRFVVYAAFPEQNVSAWVVDGKNKGSVSIALGKSIVNRTCRLKMNEVCEKFGGGGHEYAATCQIPCAESDGVLAEILQILQQ